MKKLIKLCLTAAALFAVVMTLPLSAACDEKITVNGQSVSKGDTVTYEYYMSDISDAVEAVGSYIEYDASSLEYVEGSIGFDVLNNAMYNISDGVIYFSAINVMNGYDIKDEKLIVTISFKVLDGAKGSLNITNTIDEIFTLENDEADLAPDDYKTRESLTVNTYEKNTAPYLGVDAKEVNQYLENTSGSETASGLDNYFEGNRNEDVAVSDSPAESHDVNDDSAASADIPESQSEPQTVVSEPEETVTQDSTQEKDSGKAVVIAIVIIFVVLVIGAVVFLALGRKKDGK